VILHRQRGNRASLARHDVTDAVMMPHLEGFEAPKSDEKFLTGNASVADRRRPVGSGFTLPIILRFSESYSYKSYSASYR
jgi:hypothetical protein